MSKKPKTQDLEWLIHSLMSFNGSGYADMNSPEDFLESYIAYKSMRNKPDAVMLANRHKDNVLPLLDELLQRTYGASRQPTERNLAKFESFKKQTNTFLL